MIFRPPVDPTGQLSMAGYAPNELTVLKDFGQPFFESAYRHYSIRFGMRLVEMAHSTSDACPRASVIRKGASVIVALAARDYPGIAACIRGWLWNRGIPLRQAHLFSAANQGIALDFLIWHRKLPY
jgi:hypothetical protein